MNRAARAFVAIALALAFAGCQKDEIRQYQVAKSAELNRMLVAVVPRGQSSWFFKLVGPVAEVDAREAEFKEVLDTVRFTSEREPPEFTPAKDWRKVSSPGGPTFRVGAAELTVRMAGGDLIGNVERWRGQLDLPKASPAEISKNIKPIKVAGIESSLVDLTGTGSGKTKMPQ